VEVIEAQYRVAVRDATQVGEARRVAASLSSALGLAERDAGRVALIVNELASNLHKHAGGGELLLRELRDGASLGVEVLALDRREGGMDVEASMRDGHSTSGTRGEGLGAVRRAAQEFDAFSGSAGSVVLARVWPAGPRKEIFQIGVVSQPMEREQQCGDGWAFRVRLPWLRALVVDGLGHGPLAARVAQTAAEEFQETDELPGPEAIAHRLHGALRSTRGAALAVAEIDFVSRKLRFCGIGNIAASIDNGTGRPRGLVSHAGIAGHEARRIQEFSMPWPADGLLLMHSDGIGTRWKLEEHPGLQGRHAAVIAGVLYRDFRRTTDDATVLAIKEP